MEKIEFECPACGKVLSCSPENAGKKGRCVACGTEVIAPSFPMTPDLQAPKDSLDAYPPPGAPPSMSPPGAVLPKAEPLPEKMRANRIIAGRLCGHCGKAISLGDQVVNCPICSSSMHQLCFEQYRCCATPLCKGFEAKAPQPQPPSSAYPFSEAKPAAQGNLGGLGDQRPFQQPDPATPQSMYSHDMKPCPFCGEMIQRVARKCRFCNEYLDDSLIKAQELKAENPDDKMKTSEIIFCVLCSGIACIFGIVYAIQGKKKGWKMIGLSILFSMLWSIITEVAKR